MGYFHSYPNKFEGKMNPMPKIGDSVCRMVEVEIMDEDKRVAEQKILWRSIVGTAAIGFIWIVYIIWGFYVR